MVLEELKIQMACFAVLLRVPVSCKNCSNFRLSSDAQPGNWRGRRTLTFLNIMSPKVSQITSFCVRSTYRHIGSKSSTDNDILGLHFILNVAYRFTSGLYGRLRSFSAQLNARIWKTRDCTYWKFRVSQNNKQTSRFFTITSHKWHEKMTKIARHLRI